MSLEEVIVDVSGDGKPTQDSREINSFSSKSKRDRNSAECSHKVIEKRRRDRINSCLAKLGNLLPTATVFNTSKQGSGKLEKAEILEMTVEHLKKLQAAQPMTENNLAKEEDDIILQIIPNIKRLSSSSNRENYLGGESEKTCSTAVEKPRPEKEVKKDVDTEKQYRGGYRDCTRDVLNFLVNVESMDLQHPSFQRLRAHMQHQLQLLVPNIGNVQHFQEARHRKRKHATMMQSCSSSSSSSSSSNDDRSSSSSNNMTKRPKSEKDKHSSRGEAYETSGNSSGSDKESSNSDSAVCMDDLNEDLPGKPSENIKPPSNESAFSGSSTVGSYTPPTPGLLDGLLGTLPQAIPIPLRNPYLPTPFSTPTYALHPSGTHYIPVTLHMGVPFPPYAATIPNAPGGLLLNDAPGMGLLSMAPGYLGIPLQANPYRIPFIAQNSTGFPSYPGVVPEYGFNRASHSVKMENTSAEDASSSDSRISGNGDINSSPSPNSVSDST